MNTSEDAVYGKVSVKPSKEAIRAREDGEYKTATKILLIDKSKANLHKVTGNGAANHNV